MASYVVVQSHDGDCGREKESVERRCRLECLLLLVHDSVNGCVNGCVHQYVHGNARDFDNVHECDYDSPVGQRLSRRLVPELEHG